MSRLAQYIAYHAESARAGDIDPSYAMLRYVCDRFELNDEQRYWLAFIFGLTYCGASTFYVYNEFPDFENVDSGRLNRWWAAHRRDVLCQTDRRWVRSGNMFVPAVESYRVWIGSQTQHDRFAALVTRRATPEARYDAVYRAATQLYSFGQFSLFLYLEALHTITALDLCPTDLDLDVAHSCRNGLCYAYGFDQWLTPAEARTPPGAHEPIREAWHDVLARLQASISPPPNVWNVETTLCAYKKFRRDTSRYIGAYIDRQAVEIAQMAELVQDGVAWDVLWQFRESLYETNYRAETRYSHTRLQHGVPRQWRDASIAWSRVVTGEDLDLLVQHA